MSKLPKGWMPKDGDATTVTRKMNGIETFFNGFTDTPVCSHQVGGTMYLQLKESLSAKQVYDKVRQAWIDLRALQPILGMIVCPGSRFEFKDIECFQEIEAWAGRTMEMHTICDTNAQLDAHTGSKYRNEKSEDFLPGKTGNWSDLWVMIPKEEPIWRIGLSLRVHHAFADSGTVAILASDLRRMLSCPLDSIPWGTDEFKTSERSRLPIVYSELVDQSIAMPEDQNLFDPKRIRSDLKLSHQTPAMRVKKQINESTGCGHLIRSLTLEQSIRLRQLARRNGMTITAIMHAIIALRCGKDYLEKEPDESNLWYTHFLIDCRPALTDKRNIAMSASTDLVLLKTFAKAMQLSRQGEDSRAILLLAQEAMKAYGPCKDISYRAKVARYSDELFAEIEQAVPGGEYALDKFMAICYSDSVLDERYIEVDVPQRKGGIASTILDYDTTLHINVFSFSHIRTWSFLGITKICIDYAYRFWPHDDAERLLDEVVADVIEFIG